MAATTGLTSSFQSVSQALKDAFSGDGGDSEALFNAFKALVSLVAIGAIVATLFTGGANPGSGNGDGASDSDGLPPYEYQQPDLETQDLLRDVSEELIVEINRVREDAGIIAPILPNIDRQLATQHKAEYNAATGTQKNSAENISMLQYRLPLKSRDATAIARHVMDDVFMASAAHRKIIEDPEYLYAATAAAYADGQIYVVVQFDNAQTIRADTESARANNADGSS